MNLIILDADVVIHFLELGIWDKFIENNQVYLAQTVIGEIKYYFPLSDPYKKNIVNLNEYVEVNKLNSVSIFVSDLNDFNIECQRRNAPELDIGEKETLAAVYLEKVEDSKICLAETAAIRCAVFVGLGEQCISAEQALSECGMSRKLKNQFSKKWFQGVKNKAEIDKIQFGN